MRGHHLRAIESVGGGARALTRAGVELAVRAACVVALAALPAEERDRAVGLAVEGYLDEHCARGGALPDR